MIDISHFSKVLRVAIVMLSGATQNPDIHFLHTYAEGAPDYVTNHPFV